MQKCCCMQCNAMQQHLVITSHPDIQHTLSSTTISCVTCGLVRQSPLASPPRAMAWQLITGPTILTVSLKRVVNTSIHLDFCIVWVVNRQTYVVGCEQKKMMLWWWWCTTTARLVFFPTRTAHTNTITHPATQTSYRKVLGQDGPLHRRCQQDVIFVCWCIIAIQCPFVDTPWCSAFVPFFYNHTLAHICWHKVHLCEWGCCCYRTCHMLLHQSHPIMRHHPPHTHTPTHIPLANAAPPTQSPLDHHPPIHSPKSIQNCVRNHRRGFEIHTPPMCCQCFLA